MRKRGQRGRAKATLDLIDTCIEIIEQVQPASHPGIPDADGRRAALLKRMIASSGKVFE